MDKISSSPRLVNVLSLLHMSDRAEEYNLASSLQLLADSAMLAESCEFVEERFASSVCFGQELFAQHVECGIVELPELCF